MPDVADILRENGIQPSNQRIAVGEYVLFTEDHPSAERVLVAARERLPMISRATVYNTLNLFVERGLVRQYVLSEGRVVFDPKIEDHHHFIDEDSGLIYDVPWNALTVSRVERLKGFDVREFQVVLRGKKRRRRR